MNPTAGKSKTQTYSDTGKFCHDYDKKGVLCALGSYPYIAQPAESAALDHEPEGDYSWLVGCRVQSRRDNMLDPWIIEEILRQEHEKIDQSRYGLELPLAEPMEPTPAAGQAPPAEPRGVIVIEL